MSATPNVPPGTPRPPARWRRHGLRQALFVVLLLSLVVPASVAGFFLIYQHYHHTLDIDLRLRAEKFAELLEAGLRLPLWQFDAASAQPLIDAVAADPSVSAIVVLNPDDMPLLAYRRAPATASPAGRPVDAAMARINVGPTPSIVVSRRIEMRGELLGKLTLVYATSAAREQLLGASAMLLAVIVAQMVVSLLLIGGWLRRRVIAPLDSLRASAEKISAGDLRTVVPTLGTDELGALALEFDGMRQTLAQSVMQLEARVAERTQALTDSNRQLAETLNDLQHMQNHLIQSEKLASLGALVAAVAHELNTPIGTGVTTVSTISDHVAAFRRQMAGGLRRSQLEALLTDVDTAASLAQTSLERAAQLIQDFKQVAVDQTSSRRRHFELAEVVREILVAIRFRHKHFPLRFAVDVPNDIFMESYPGALEQVISNLVENAVMHAFDGRTQPTDDNVLQISARPGAGRVLLTVADNGKGIAAAQLPRIFDPFFTTRLGRGGSGLGLAIVYNLVTGLLGGLVTVTSGTAGGASFAIDLPLDTEMLAASETAS